ncbi:MAG: RDD family protein [Nocardioidaceae bacterium]
MEPSDTEPDAWPGQRLGLPADGPGAVAGWGRRLVALLIDWTLSLLALGAFVGADVWTGRGAVQWGPLVIFGFEVWILTTLLGSSAGQVITRIVVRRTSGQPLDIFRALLRTVLICLVLPPVIYNRDQQGLHDLAVDSIVLRR